MTAEQRFTAIVVEDVEPNPSSVAVAGSASAGEVADTGERGTSDVARSPSPATSTILHPGRTCCDGYPVCRFRGEGIPLRNHMRKCPESDAGAIYRVLAWYGSLS
jgi:hypothetical protein